MMSQMMSHESLIGRVGGLLVAQDADTETHQCKTVLQLYIWASKQFVAFLLTRTADKSVLYPLSDAFVHYSTQFLNKQYAISREKKCANNKMQAADVLQQRRQRWKFLNSIFSRGFFSDSSFCLHSFFCSTNAIYEQTRVVMFRGFFCKDF